MGYLTLNGINLPCKNIKSDPQRNVNIKNYLEGGSYTKPLGRKGRQIELTVYGDESNIGWINVLRNYDGLLTLVSQSKANYNGIYRIVNDPISEEAEKSGTWEYTVTLQEHKEFNVTKMDYTTFSSLITKKPVLKTVKTKVTKKKK